MSQRSDEVCLRHMLDHAREAVAMASDKVREDLDSNRMLELSLIRLIEIVGEAANRVNPEFQQSHSDIPWAKVRGMRNRLIHGYDAVDFNILWDTVRFDLPQLITILEPIVGL
jgi:uncharacterized protein with HEPN domain